MKGWNREQGEADTETTHLGQICVTPLRSCLLFLVLFVLLFFLFLIYVAPVLGNVTKLKVALNVQDLQVFQPPEGAFHHGAHGQLVEPERRSRGQCQVLRLMPLCLPSSEGKRAERCLGHGTASCKGGEPSCMAHRGK